MVTWQDVEAAREKTRACKREENEVVQAYLATAPIKPGTKVTYLGRTYFVKGASEAFGHGMFWYVGFRIKKDGIPSKSLEHLYGITEKDVIQE